ncbi:RDD family protein [Acinetobacter larvae]|uniref:RDD family protein n=1 Tax=Acinetobacter larvae TaxID=1789224 RepID=A0A1B2M3Z9_9GAMM|nr:RDD family protein [Acinetobacter larvae]AOA59894.1 RDD family protein [Acinetobacter larvae]
MQIYLARNNQQAGPYSLEQINQMLANQQILLTDLAWHQGMKEWKALGELTQGKLVYQPAPEFLVAPPSKTTQTHSSTTATNNQQLGSAVTQQSKAQVLASVGARFAAKLIDLLLWIPAFSLPAFFLNAEQAQQLEKLQEQIPHITTAVQATEFRQSVYSLFPEQAWFAMFAYIIIMLLIQAFLLAKSGQSIGKKALKIKIVDAQSGGPVNLTRIFLLRSVVFMILSYILTPFVFIIDSLFIFTEKKQTLHDKLAKTKVIKQ